MRKFLGIIAVVLLVYFVITRPVAAAEAAEDIGGALATVAGSLVVFTDSLVAGTTTDDPAREVSSSDVDVDVETDVDGPDGADPARSVPTSVPAGAP